MIIALLFLIFLALVFPNVARYIIVTSMLCAGVVLFIGGLVVMLNILTN